MAKKLTIELIPSTSFFTNVQVYAHREDSDFHNQAATVLQELADGDGRWSIPWPCLHEFLAITKHPGIFARPTPLSLALHSWLESPRCEMIGEDSGYYDVLKDVATKAKIAGAMIPDAQMECVQKEYRRVS